MNCADCEEKDCYRGEDCSVVRGPSERALQDPEVARTMAVAAAIEAEGYGRLGRVQEVARFAQDMGYERLGMAFCIGLSDEARALEAYYELRGFRVFSVCCKVCGLSKAEHGWSRLHPEWDLEASCNPVGQALELERCRTDLNLAVGLCVGHDVLFGQHSCAPVTTLVVKDRVHAHAPASVLHTRYGRRSLGL